VPRGFERATPEIRAEHDTASGQWRFLIVGVRGKVMYESEPQHETEVEARAAARDWLTQTLLR